MSKNVPTHFDINKAITEDVTNPNKLESTIIEIRDASTETAKILVPQMGSDHEYLKRGAVDPRRFSHIDEADPLWISYFKNIPKEQGGDYARSFIDEYLNTCYSVNGRHKKLVEGMQRAVSNKSENPTQPRNRSLADKILGRNKEGED